MTERRIISANMEGPEHQAHERISHTTENYLRSLFVLQEEGIWPTPAQLADSIRRLPVGEGLGVSLPSVLGMVRRMIKEELVEMSPEKHVRLTERGKMLAENTIRRHRLAERMVVDLLGLELHKAHVEAHRLEHVISRDVEARVQEQLGNPTTCPFGRPIPGSGYKAPLGRQLTMDQAEPGHSYIIHRIPEEDQELLRFLVDQDVLPDGGLTIIEAGHYRGVITFRTNQGEAALGLQAASRIWLREPPPG